MPLYAYRGVAPTVAEGAFLAPSADIVGAVTIGPGASVWFNAVVRGDRDIVSIGANTNIQDCAVLHTDRGAPCILEEDCTVGHAAVVHGCLVGSGSLIGIGAIILSGSQIGPESLVGAGCVVPQGKQFPPRSLLLGVPARLVRTLTTEDVNHLIRPRRDAYLELTSEYLLEAHGR